jgi:Excalibur calcium-binding domain
MNKVITATVGAALISGALLAAGAANADVYYENCDVARKAGVTPLYEGDPGYAPHLDRDHDGVACE